jgi:hypothetical protein
MTEFSITKLLCKHEYWDSTQGIVWLPQQRMGCGYGNDFERTIDVFGISTCKPWTRFAIEIKVSRSDFKADVCCPMKQRRARLIANKFYYLAPQGLLTPEDIPIWAGLAEVVGEHIDVTVEAPWQESSAPTWRMVAQLARRAARSEKGQP